MLPTDGEHVGASTEQRTQQRQLLLNRSGRVQHRGLCQRAEERRRPRRLVRSWVAVIQAEQRPQALVLGTEVVDVSQRGIELAIVSLAHRLHPRRPRLGE